MAFKNYESYEGKVSPYDDASIGQERESIKVVLDDPDGRKRQAGQDFLDTAGESIPYICTLMSFGACASIGGTITIAVDALSTYNHYLENNEIEAEYGSGKVIVGAIGSGIDSQLDSIPNRKVRYFGKVINATYGKVIADVADKAVETENKVEKN